MTARCCPRWSATRPRWPPPGCGRPNPPGTRRPAWPRTRRRRSRSTSAALATSSNPPDRVEPDPESSTSRGQGFRAALESVLPFERFGDQRTILAGTGQSAVGLVVAIVATFGTQVLITRTLGAGAFGIVTMATQGALILGYFSRVGMDMAAVREVAIEAGQGRRGRVRGIVARASVIAAVARAAVAGPGVVFP